MKTCQVLLKPGREKSVRAFHPWIFSGAIDRLDSELGKGDLVKVYSSAEEFLGIGYLNPLSQIAVRILSFRDEAIDAAFFVRRMEQAKKLRQSFVASDTNAYRCVHSEGDFLPGLIIDRYGDWLVAQFLTAGMDRLKLVAVEAAEKVFQPKGIFERDDAHARRLEGLEHRPQTLSGAQPPSEIEIEEYGNKFWVDVKRGQKTGFFLDQRENRKLIAPHAQGKRVLDCFAYSGAFSIYAARSGAASVTAVESQAPAVKILEANLKLNGLNGEVCRVHCEDVFDFLRKDTGTYDLIILDPPAFCKHKGQIHEAARGYKDINLNAIKRLAPGGILLTSSCSSFIGADVFQKIVFGAARDAGREVQILQKTSHAFDHPINIYHPEGEYLKGLLLKVW
ncbi:MAG: hypothetical protein A3G87_09665 [Omnitrophica bacterium RIFCSPLOWO2_12_FULL_50_11]|nr:MAG: hypothetical protein A3G87_09665 [Omnitrophica bacterium RIFCSPLOWO2_12_FULL_50_11]